MSARSFRSVFMVASCAGAALGCYLVSLRVASERAALEQVETRIVLAQRDIRLLQTEIGTRGRLAQLERWNVKVLALSAPSADQFLDGGFALAKLARPEQEVPIDAPVVLASAEAPAPQPAPLEQEASEESRSPRLSGTATQLMHQASLKRPERQAAMSSKRAEAIETTVQPKTKADARPARSPAAAASDIGASPKTHGKPATKKPAEKQVALAGKPGTKPSPKKERAAASDPLAPLPVASGSSKTTKGAGSKQ